jgi:hypothetical protein
MLEDGRCLSPIYIRRRPPCHPLCRSSSRPFALLPPARHSLARQHACPDASSMRIGHALTPPPPISQARWPYMQSSRLRHLDACVCVHVRVSVSVSAVRPCRLPPMLPLMPPPSVCAACLWLVSLPPSARCKNIRSSTMCGVAWHGMPLCAVCCVQCAVASASVATSSIPPAPIPLSPLLVHKRSCPSMPAP